MELPLLMTLVLVPWVALVLLTVLGSHRRGAAAGVSALAGTFFPVTWAVWYVRDERPYGRDRAGLH